MYQVDLFPLVILQDLESLEVPFRLLCLVVLEYQRVRDLRVALVIREVLIRLVILVDQPILVNLSLQQGPEGQCCLLVLAPGTAT
jgi:hypothetical protein